MIRVVTAKTGHVRNIETKILFVSINMKLCRQRMDISADPMPWKSTPSVNQCIGGSVAFPAKKTLHCPTNAIFGQGYCKRLP
jgi:hypothetical protein